MAKYMLTYQIPTENRAEAIKRFATDARNPPEGITRIGQWHSAARLGGFGLVETDDPTRITAWCLQWSDIINYQVEPVITDEELGVQLQALGL